jgi:hypothetical protein
MRARSGVIPGPLSAKTEGCTHASRRVLLRVDRLRRFAVIKDQKRYLGQNHDFETPRRQSQAATTCSRCDPEVPSCINDQG